MQPGHARLRPRGPLVLIGTNRENLESRSYLWTCQVLTSPDERIKDLKKYRVRRTTRSKIIGGIMRLVVVVVILGVFVTSCKQKEEEAPVETYAGAGRVVEVNPEPGRILIKHSDIPDFMPAMIMAFKIQSPVLLTGVQNEDSVHFTLSRTDTGVVITQIEVIK